MATTTTTTVSSVATGSPALAPALEGHAERDARKATSRGGSFAWKLLEGLAYAGACVDPSGILAMQRIRQDMTRAGPPPERRWRVG